MILFKYIRYFTAMLKVNLFPDSPFYKYIDNSRYVHGKIPKIDPQFPYWYILIYKKIWTKMYLPARIFE